MKDSMLALQLTTPKGEHLQEFLLPLGTTGRELCQAAAQLVAADQVLAMSYNGELWELDRPIEQPGTVSLLTWEDDLGKQAFWHSSAHVLAEALQALYPEVKLGIGPPIAQGFYYDVDTTQSQFQATDLARIEQKMLALSRARNPFVRKEVSKKEAQAYLEAQGETYKLEILEGLADGQITLYQQGNFTDLCRGGHVPHTGWIQAVKLTGVAGAYWRGDTSQKQLTRIYGVSFPSAQGLQEYLDWLEEAQKRNHQNLGRSMKLFSFSQRVGLGLPLWLPQGARLREALEAFLRKAQEAQGYLPVITPHIASRELYITSGHEDKYGADAFQPITTPKAQECFRLKPMNCPHHCEIYQSEPRSYRDLPLRLAEFGTVYRYEQHGELNGLVRVRGFTQDDAHIFCRPDQVHEEFSGVIALVQFVFRSLGLHTYTAQLSVRDPKRHEDYIGDADMWEQAEKAIMQAAQSAGLAVEVVEGEAAFYGPKLDFMVQDALGRKWQLGTIQLDYQLPQRFGLTYTGADNQKHCPVMIHRAPFGSLERLIAILLEHTAGKLPLWLSPTQLTLLPIGPTHVAYAQELRAYLQEKQVRTSVDARQVSIRKKIREAEGMKIPYMAIVGDAEQEHQKVALRKQAVGDVGVYTWQELLDKLADRHAPSYFAAQNILDILPEG